MNEAGVWRMVRERLWPLDPFRVENPIGPGTPDVAFQKGWIELKWLVRLPLNPDIVVKVPKFRPEQRAWLISHSRRGTRCWLLMVADQEWFLFRGEAAALNLGRTWSTRDLRKQGSWKTAPTSVQLLDALQT